MRKVYFKKTVWESFEIPDNISDEEIIGLLSKQISGNSFHRHFDATHNLDLKWEDDYESEEYLSPRQNNRLSTIEFIKDGNIEWENGESNYCIS